MVLLPVVVLLVVGEIVLRMIPPDPSILLDFVEPTDDPRAYVLKPDSRTVFQGLYETLPEPVIWEVNKDGIRSDHPIGPKRGRYRILTYGDSETFGWSVQLEDTWQRRMEAKDDRVEVINLGVPGYNVENVADHMLYTAADLNPDLMIYLFHKNDFDEPLTATPFLSRSEVYVHIRMAIYAIGKKHRRALRKTPEAHRFVAAQIGRMLDISEKMNVPLIIAFMHGEFQTVLNRRFWKDDAFERASALVGTDGFSVRAVNVEPIIKGLPRIDSHLTSPGQQALADYFCELLSGSRNNGCLYQAAPSSGQ